MLKLLIADGSETFSDALRELLDGDFEVITCNNGYDVIPLLHKTSPDLFLLDLMLPGCDGITILESVCAMDNRPIVLVVSRIFGFYVQDSLERLGVCYAMQKPCDVNSVCNRLKELAQYPKSKLLPIAEEEEMVHGMLRALGFAGKHIGYRCLVRAICMIANNPEQQYTKELYPAVGAEFGCTWRQVERDIRTAISSAWETRNTMVWDEFFPSSTDFRKKPSNSVMISTLGQLLRKNRNALVEASDRP